MRKLREAFSDNNRYGYYNSNLFAFHECDKPSVHVGDDVLTEVIEGLYESKESRIKYQFSEIESDVLGSIYEQYLSHLLRKRKKGGLDESFAKKKQQGIYYTPTYVVDYIVSNTLGKVLSESGAKEIENTRVLDMACGSGSFLIKCYDSFEEAHLMSDNKQGGGTRINNN
jgi:type I restriction-modification system DNA methylase subunit